MVSKYVHYKAEQNNLWSQATVDTNFRKKMLTYFWKIFLATSQEGAWCVKDTMLTTTAEHDQASLSFEYLTPPPHL